LVYASKIIGISEGKKDIDRKCHEELDQEKAQHVVLAISCATRK
jgi:hypothetical protein